MTRYVVLDDWGKPHFRSSSADEVVAMLREELAGIDQLAVTEHGEEGKTVYLAERFLAAHEPLKKDD